jgi:hypothetical protein
MVIKQITKDDIHRVFKDMAAKGKTSVDWFFGLHIRA